MLKLGNTTINKVYLGATEINKVYLGNTIIFQAIQDVLGKPILSNFRVEDTNKDRVLFDASSNISGLVSQGFTIRGKTISGLTIDGDGLGGYITVTSAFTHWDNYTIELDGGNGVVLDFYRTHIVNNISEPTAATVRYVTNTASGGADGTSEGNAWTMNEAWSNASAGMTIYVKAGNYGFLNFSGAKSGAIDNPIKFIGYKTTPGDITDMYYTYGDGALTASEMPTFTSTQSYPASVDLFSLSSSTYVIMKNMQCTDYSASWYTNNATGVVIDNCLAVQSTGYGFVSLGENGFNNRVTNCMAVNGNACFWHSGDHGLYENCKAYANEGTRTVNYYFALEGDDNITKNTYALKDGNTSTVPHFGHGMSVHKVNWSSTRYNLIEDHFSQNIAKGAELRKIQCQYTVVRNFKSIGTGIGATDNGGIEIRDATSFNVIDGYYVEYGSNGAGIYFSESHEDGVGGGNDNLIMNGYINGNGAGGAIYSNMSQSVETTNYNNKFINFTFDNCAYLRVYGTTGLYDVNNELINCIFNDITNLSTGSYAFSGWTFTNNLFWNSWATGTGTGAINLDPVLDVNKVPTATFESIDVAVNPNNKIDYNGELRADNTTVGFKKHANEVSTPDTTAPLFVSAVVENTATSSLVMTYDEALDATSVPATTDFSVNDGAANAVTNVSISGSDVTLTLTNAIDSGDTVTVSYTKGVNPLQDSDANECVNLTNESVTNNVVGNLFPQDNAASTNPEVNAVGTGLVVQGVCTVASSAAQASNGSYSLLTTSTAGGGTSYAQFLWNTTIGNTYRITLDYRAGTVGNDPEIKVFNWSSITGNNNAVSVTDNTQWLSKTWDAVANASTMWFWVIPNQVTDNAGAEIYIDNVSVTEL